MTIGSDILSAKDPDTDDLKLTFIINRTPRLGMILKNGLAAERSVISECALKVAYFADLS